MTTGSVLLISALKLMGIGMGVVFLMLGIMVLAIKWLSRLVSSEEVESITQAAPPCVCGVATPATIAVIGAAIHRYQSDHLTLSSNNSSMVRNGAEERI